MTQYQVLLTFECMGLSAVHSRSKVRRHIHRLPQKAREAAFHISPRGGGEGAWEAIGYLQGDGTEVGAVNISQAYVAPTGGAARTVLHAVEGIVIYQRAVVVVCSRHTSDVGGAAHPGVQREAVAHGAAVVPPHQAADKVAVSADAARGIAVLHCAASVRAHQAADKEATVDTARGIAVLHCAGVIAHQAADIVAATVDTARSIAVVHCAAGVLPHQAADIVAAAVDTSRGIAVVHCALVVIAHQAADIFSPADTDFCQPNVLQGGALAYTAK